MIKKFVIDRSQWYPAEVHSDILHLDEGVLHNNGRMCCLGVFLVANGYDPIVLDGYPMPDNVLNKETCDPELYNLLVNDNVPNPACRASKFAGGASDANDSSYITTEEREQRIIDLFAAEGIEVTFVGDLDLDEVENNLRAYGADIDVE